MREEDFRRVLAEWKVWSLPKLVEREVRLPANSSYVVAITGPRRAKRSGFTSLSSSCCRLGFRGATSST